MSGGIEGIIICYRANRGRHEYVAPRLPEVNAGAESAGAVKVKYTIR